MWQPFKKLWLVTNRKVLNGPAGDENSHRAYRKQYLAKTGRDPEWSLAVPAAEPIAYILRWLPQVGSTDWANGHGDSTHCSKANRRFASREGRTYNLKFRQCSRNVLSRLPFGDQRDYSRTYGCPNGAGVHPRPGRARPQPEKYQR